MSEEEKNACTYYLRQAAVAGPEARAAVEQRQRELDHRRQRRNHADVVPGRPGRVVARPDVGVVAALVCREGVVLRDVADERLEELADNERNGAAEPASRRRREGDAVGAIPARTPGRA